ncbi:hypothetical protein LTR95_009160 [Oleoguttula sp. CCFEE 5521]
MESAMSTKITSLTIPETFTPADSCTRRAFQPYPLGIDHLAVNSTTRVGHGYTAIYTTTVITRGVASDCYPTRYESLGKTVQPNATADAGVATYVAGSYAAESCPPSFVAHIGNPTSAPAPVTTCCPTGMAVITTIGPVLSPYICSQLNQGAVTIDFESYTTIIPTETPVGIIAAAVFIAPREGSQASPGTTEASKIAIAVGCAALGALLLGAIVVGSMWWGRRKRSEGSSGKRWGDRFELLGK